MEIVEVSSIKQYLKERVVKGQLSPFFAVQVATVSARQGKIGEIINSFSMEGNYSTTKTVFRTTNGEIDWVITDELGESVVLDDESFKKDYEETDTIGTYRSKQTEKLIVQVHECIQFRGKHGNVYRVMPEHFVVADQNGDFYELTPKGLQKYYRILNKTFDASNDTFLF